MSTEKSDHVIERPPVPEGYHIQVPDLEGDNVLDLTQRVRIQMLKQYLMTGQLPQDAKDAAVIVKLLADMDKQDLGKKKLVIDEKNVGVNSEIAAAGIALMRKIGGSKADPYAVSSSQPRTAPSFDQALTQNIEVLPGETDLSPRDFSTDPI